MKIDKTVCYCYFSQKSDNYVGDLFEINEKMISWEDFRAKLDLDDNNKFYPQNPSCLERNVLRAW